ncbi:Transcription factor DYT1, partial [Bienertia sinuspersici]
MTKAYIIKDAITYIEELDSQVSELKDELMELGNNTPPKEETKPAIIKGEINITAKEMIKNYGIEPEVKVIPIDDNKLWIKVVYEKKMGGFSQLVETINRLGLEFSDTNLTTSHGTAVISSCLEGMSDGCLNVEEARELIMN